MTLDEAIKRSEEVMVENIEKTKGRNASDPIAINCFECAGEHRQLAEWLRDYKRMLEQEPKYCDRNICMANEYNGIGCDECEVTKSQEPSGDLINRAEAIKAIDEKAKRIKNEDTLNGLAGAVGILFDLPSYNSIKTELSGDLISRQAVLDQTYLWSKDEFLRVTNPFDYLRKRINSLLPVTPQQKTEHCEDCKHFRKLPYHIDILGKCICHTGFCPKGDWYCADYEPPERSE